MDGPRLRETTTCTFSNSLFLLAIEANYRLARIINNYLIGWNFPCPFTGWAFVALITRANSDTGWALFHFKNRHNQA